MNNQLIEKVIRSDDSITCPELIYNYPLIDRNVASALARSFVKMFTDSQHDSNLNNNLRHAVLSNIRKICRTVPENHVEVDENFTDSLSEVYMNQITSQNRNHAGSAAERSLDEFLMRNMKDIVINSNMPSNNPEVIQALVNLNNNKNLSSILKNVLHWNIADEKYLNLVKNLWTNISVNDKDNLGDLSIKNKSEIEAFLLNICLSILTDGNIKIQELITQENLSDLIRKCSISSDCFQICMGILNSIFIHTNYNLDIQFLIKQFILNIKDSCTISVLYPVHLRHVVVLLDINIECFPAPLNDKYTKDALEQLMKLHENSETDFILLLSHFPQWFDIYFDAKT